MNIQQTNSLRSPVRSLLAWTLTIFACAAAAHAQVVAPSPVAAYGLPGAGASPGVALATLHNFVPVTWAGPNGLVQGSDGNFYGTTNEGGCAAGFGAVFQLTPGGSLTTLYSFSGGNDGGGPISALVQGSDGNFYGTTQSGGSSNAGTVFQITPSGSLTTLYAFTGGNDGATPNGLVQGSDGNFYGTTQGGGANADGTVFQITSSGALTTLYSFSALSGGVNTDGADPCAGLIQGNDGNFYGTTDSGGASGQGTLFQVTSGGSLTSLYSFTGGNDGGQPFAGVIQGSDGNFYGTTQTGGSGGWGTAYQIPVGGTVSTPVTLNTLYAFTGGNDGGNPNALIQGNDGNLYGTAQYGGSTNAGTVFQLTASGGFTALYEFTGGNDGGNAQAGLIQGSDGNFYGATPVGGAYADGTVFQITPGGALTTLYSGSPVTDGANPAAALVQGSDGNFYGATQYGGSWNSGTVFQMMPGGFYNVLYAFTGGNDGAGPAALVEGNDGNFYGTSLGGENCTGTVFQITSSGSLTTLYAFSALSTGTNADGSNPCAGVMQGNDGNFYGTTDWGGIDGQGTVFQVTSSGTLTTLYTFTGGNDGGEPLSGVIQGSDGNFYGTAQTGGSNGWGTVYQLVPGGSLNTLYSFTGGNDGGYPNALVEGTDGNFYGTTAGNNGSSSDGTVFEITSSGSLTTLYAFTGGNDGGYPQAGLVQGSDGNFYGTTSAGGCYGGGTAFQVTSGGSLTTLYSFTGGNDGAYPEAGLIQGSDGNFYGTTFGQIYGSGNNSDNGTVFQLNVSSLSTGPIGPVGPIGIVIPISVGPIWIGTPIWVGSGTVILDGGQPTTGGLSGLSGLAGITPLTGSVTGPLPEPTDLLAGVGTSAVASLSNTLSSGLASAGSTVQAVSAAATANNFSSGPALEHSPTSGNVGIGGSSLIPETEALTSNGARSNGSIGNSLSAGKSFLSPQPSGNLVGSDDATGAVANGVGSGIAAASSADSADSAIGSPVPPEPGASGTDTQGMSDTGLALNMADSQTLTASVRTGFVADRIVTVSGNTGGAAAGALPPAGSSGSANSTTIGGLSAKVAKTPVSTQNGVATRSRNQAKPTQAGGAGIYTMPVTFAVAPDQIFPSQWPGPAYSAGVAAGIDAAFSLPSR